MSFAEGGRLLNLASHEMHGREGRYAMHPPAGVGVCAHSFLRIIASRRHFSQASEGLSELGFHKSWLNVCGLWRLLIA
jgi:hypothetical protein